MNGIKIKILSVCLVASATLFSGCASMNANGLTSNAVKPIDEGYRTFSQTYNISDAEATSKLKKIIGIINSNKKTNRINNINPAAEALYQKGVRNYYRGNLTQGLLQAQRARRNAIRVEPSEVVAVEKNLYDPKYKKLVVELEEWDIVDGCKNAVSKLFNGFEKRYLYAGAIKQGENSWEIYISYPKVEVQSAGPADRNCMRYIHGAEAHASNLAERIVKYLSKS